MEFVNQPIIPLTGFVLTLAFGVWLNRAGQPYPAALFNIHKLIALGVVVLGTTQVWRSGRLAALSGGESAAYFLIGFSVLALFVSGALMSAGQLDPRQMRFTHTIAAILLTTAGLGAYWLAGR